MFYLSLQESRLRSSIKEEKMEELPLGVKILGVALCLGAVVLLATYDRLIKILRRSSKSTKTG
jgi:drug/metabolite transporter (DMT)-like permease